MDIRTGGSERESIKSDLSKKNHRERRCVVLLDTLAELGLGLGLYIDSVLPSLVYSWFLKINVIL